MTIKTPYFKLSLLLLLVSTFTNCNKEKLPDLVEFPIFSVNGIITLPATNVSSNSAISGADFQNFSNEIVEKGLCWSTNPKPDLNTNFIKIEAGNNSFKYTISGLKPATQYHVRAFATTKNNRTFYGSEVSFVTIELNYKQYNSLPNSYREEYYTCNFNEPTPIWRTYTSNPIGMFYAKYTNLGYEIKNNYSSSKLISGIIDNIGQQDFEIEYTFRRIEMPYFNSVSFIWGLKNSNTIKFYYLKLSSKYDLSINIGCFDNEEKEWVNHTNFDNYSFNRYGENKFTIRRIKNKYYFFVNEVFLFEHDFQSFFGNRIGIVMGGPSEAIFKTMKIDYLINL